MKDIFLEERLKLVNSYFSLSSLPAIKWSKGKIKNRYRKITFGCYDIKKNEIRIHPILKSKKLPLFVLDFVIFHELLHFVERENLKDKNFMRALKKKGRIHNHDFKRKEGEFPFAKSARGYLKELLNGEIKPF